MALLDRCNRTLSLSHVCLLTVFIYSGCNTYYKICDDRCLMYTFLDGARFDKPCADNVCFVVARNHFQPPPADEEESIGAPDDETGMDGESGMTGEEGTAEEDTDYDTDDFRRENPLGPDYASYEAVPGSLAIHEPLYPMVAGTNSEEITFSLRPAEGSTIESAKLYIRKIDVTRAEVVGVVAPYPDFVDGDLVGTWTQEGGNAYKRKIDDTESFVPRIYFTKTFGAIPGGGDKITYIKYRFSVKYLGYPEPETMDISFALQNFHQVLPSLPAPVYVQGNMESSIDILLIPAVDHDETWTEDHPPRFTPKMLDDFRMSCLFLISDSFFEEPILRFWRKEFNYYINKQEGMAIDYRKRQDSPHGPPKNWMDGNIGDEFEVRALLHKSFQRDFTDNSYFFSAKIDNSCEANAFLHELGHAAFDLYDEYPGGKNKEEREKNFPNNWENKSTAREEASARHKTPDDARKIR